MPVTSSAKKALRRDRRRTIINQRVKRKIKAALKEIRQKPTQKALVKTASILDRAAKKKIIHKNKANRLKSKLAKLLETKKAKSA